MNEDIQELLVIVERRRLGLDISWADDGGAEGLGAWLVVLNDELCGEDPDMITALEDALSYYQSLVDLAKRVWESQAPSDGPLA